jgi:branched-chain amino acid transport system ATP-binding protein
MTLALQLSGLGFHAGGVTILEDINLEVVRGEFLGIIGPNGAGKTTLFNLLSGLLRPTSGTMCLNGRAIGSLAAADRARLGLGRTFQTSTLFGALPVAENARLAAQARLAGSFLPGMRWWHRPRSADEASQRAAQALEAVGISHLANLPASSLSHGDKRKLELAILMAGEAEVLLLDEPMAGVNGADIDGLTSLIKQLHAEGRTVLMVEHHMAVVLGLAERVAVLHHGQLLACGQPQEVMANETVQLAYLGDPL